MGAGFENPNLPENQISFKLLSIQGWNEFSVILKELGYTELSGKYSGYAKEKTAGFLNDPDWCRNYRLHVSADAINAGVAAGADAEYLYTKNFTDRLNRLSYSPFNQYFIFQAMAKLGNYDDAVFSILDMYGGQIEYGGTTFFEVYRPGWNDSIETNAPVPNAQVGFTSLAHPWGAGVLSWMSEEILGIKADTAGFRTFSVTPHVGRQITSVSGEMPTPYGVIGASFDTSAGTAALNVPEGIIGRIGIPKTEKTIESIKMNGMAASIAGQDENFMYIEGFSAGTYAFEIVYSGRTPAPRNNEYIYPAEFLGRDNETKGNWGGVYGVDGYLLCSYDPADRRSLPGYVENVSFRLAKNVQWSSKTKDGRALASNCDNVGDRKIGAYHTDGQEPIAQSFTVDIDLRQEKEYTAALYFVDWNDEGLELAVDMFDGESLETIAPFKVLTDYSGGAYLVFKYNRSARFRIGQIRGDYATLSGIFFGEGAAMISRRLREQALLTLPEINNGT